MNAFGRFAVVVASTKRPPVVAGGKRGTPATYLTGLSITPLDPVDPELRQRLALDTPHELRQSFATGSPDILEGDLLVVGSIEYPIRSVAQWAWRGSTYVHMVVEELKR